MRKRQTNEDTVGNKRTLPASETPTLPLIGAHISTAGGLAPVPQRAVGIGAEVVQVFNANARTWRGRVRTPQEIASLVEGLRRHRLPLFLHTIYLINLASPDEQLRRRSTEALSEALVMGALSEARGVVTHIGSRHDQSFATAVGLVTTAVNEAYLLARERLQAETGDPNPASPRLLVETTAGAGTTVGGRLEELGELLQTLPRSCGVCLDTAHLFAAGYPIHTEEGLRETLAELEEHDLTARVGLIHLNDSKSSLASSLDRHENLGDGQIGLEGLGRVIRHPAFRTVPFVLEVPGLGDHGPDAANMERAKSMRRGAPVPPEPPARSA